MAEDRAASTRDPWYEAFNATAFQIWLVIIVPDGYAEEVSCHLEIASLSYEALSYVWGNLHETKPIKLNGKPYEVTINLESALRHLRLNGA